MSRQRFYSAAAMNSKLDYSISKKRIMRVKKPTVAYKLVQLCSKNLKGEPWRIIIKTHTQEKQLITEQGSIEKRD